MKFGRVFYDTDMWIKELTNYDIYVGTRLHGVIAALLAGIRSLLVVHDSRTLEVSKFCSIPHVRIDNLKEVLTQYQVDMLYDTINMDEYYQAFKNNYMGLKNFYLNNNIPTRM